MDTEIKDRHTEIKDRHTEIKDRHGNKRQTHRNKRQTHGNRKCECFGSFVEELLVEQEDEQVHVDLGFIEHLHHRYALVLQLQQILEEKTTLKTRLMPLKQILEEKTTLKTR